MFFLLKRSQLLPLFLLSQAYQHPFFYQTQEVPLLSPDWYINRHLKDLESDTSRLRRCEGSSLPESPILRKEYWSPLCPQKTARQLNPDAPLQTQVSDWSRLFEASLSPFFHNVFFLIWPPIITRRTFFAFARSMISFWRIAIYNDQICKAFQPSRLPNLSSDFIK